MIRPHLSLRSLAGLALLPVLLVGFTQCTSSTRKVCEAERDCTGGNDKDLDACIAASKATEEAAEEYGCGSAFDDFADCLEGSSKCVETKLGSGTIKSLDTSACASQSNTYRACVKAASGRPNSTTTESSSSGSSGSSPTIYRCVVEGACFVCPSSEAAAKCGPMGPTEAGCIAVDGGC